MAIKLPNGDILRNLYEQVQENKLNIQKHYDADRVLEDYGIKVIGHVDFMDQLPAAGLYTGAYGDAYTVGVSTPYEFYIFTRPFSGETENQWFNLGELAIQGPKGEQGPEGPQGPKGDNTRWYMGQNDPYGTGYDEGDCFLNTKTGEVFIFEANAWTPQGSIKGATGAQGPKGEKGDKGDPGEPGLQGEAGVPGDAVKIVGILSSPSMLPDPNTVDRDNAYVVSDTVGSLLFFITGLGTEANPLIWKKVPFENGTTVLVGGNPVEVFDADTKLSKPTKDSNYTRVPFVRYGEDTFKYKTLGTTIAQGMKNGWIPQYNPINRENNVIPDGQLATGTPQYDGDAANKKYVDDTVAAMGDTKYDKLPVNNSYDIFPFIVNGTDKLTYKIYASNIASSASSRIPGYNPAGRDAKDAMPTGKLVSGMPEYGCDCANKKYVDDRITTRTEGIVQQLLQGESTAVPLPIEYGTTPYFQIEINTYGANKTTTGVAFSTDSGTLYNYIKILYTPTSIHIIAQDLAGNGFVSYGTTTPTLYAIKASQYITFTYTKLNLPTT